MRKKSDEYSDLGDSPNYETKDLLLPNGLTVSVFVDADKAFEQGTKDFSDVFSAIRLSLIHISTLNLLLNHEYTQLFLNLS